MKYVHSLVRHAFSLKPPTLVVGAIVFAICVCVVRAGAQSDALVTKYTNGQVFDVRDSQYKVKADLKGFMQTYDQSINDNQVFVAGNKEAKVVMSCVADTMLTDIDATPKAYEDLWWYFYSKDTALHMEHGRSWEDKDRYFSTHTITSMYGMEVNEKHFDLFQLADGKYFHVSIKRPLYQEGDSTFMLQTLNSFELIPPTDAASDEAK